MKTRLLKKIRRRFTFKYHHERNIWLVIDNQSPIHLLVPMKVETSELNYTHAEVMASVVGNMYLVSYRRQTKSIRNLVRSLSAFTILMTK